MLTVHMYILYGVQLLCSDFDIIVYISFVVTEASEDKLQIVIDLGTGHVSCIYKVNDNPSMKMGEC